MVDSDNKKQLDEDFDFSRDTYYDLIEKGRESLDLMMEVARESEHPRAFEVLANTMRSISDINDRLMDLQKKRKEINQKSENPKALPDNSGTTNNNVFIGSTTELQRFLTGSSEEKDVTPKDE